MNFIRTLGLVRRRLFLLLIAAPFIVSAGCKSAPQETKKDEKTAVDTGDKPPGETEATRFVQHRNKSRGFFGSTLDTAEDIILLPVYILDGLVRLVSGG